ncbi:carbonic anhydrase [Sphingorhabdus sp. Alg239-R122]|uniref:carbonic anhydrase n=1 Tax=Sphingorhabdus sp. Alg239-R122 TaxID=2305989 RepID=UPI0013DC03A6|nr:carbonic anhydrase [Sphingorhabdus sp. Alg239-R122]
MTNFSDLIAGYHRFRENDWNNQRDRWCQLSQGQSPKTMIIACSDSRVDPTQIFDTSPGEIFVVRNVAALVPPYETGGGYHGVSAALEFAVTQLKVEEIVVMGHGACGGCKAALERSFDESDFGEGGFIKQWIELLEPAREAVASQTHETAHDADIAMEQAGVQVSLVNLRTFPFVAKAEETGTLKLHGSHFAIETGILHVLDQASGKFAPAS